MPTIIDALVVTLGLDTTNFQKGEKEVGAGLKKTKEQSSDVAKTMAEEGKKAGQFFGNIKTELMALVGISLSIKGLKDLIIGTANNMATLGRTAPSLGLSARALSAWQNAAEGLGGTAEGITQSMQSMSDSIAAFSIGKGGGDFVATLNSLGIAARDSKGDIKDTGQLLLEISEQFEKRKLSPALARQYGAGLGLDTGTINMLLEGPNKVRQVYADMYKNSGVTEEGVRRSKEFQVTWAKIEQTFQGVRERLFTALIPYIEKLLVLLDRFANWISTHQNEINQVFTSIADAIMTVTTAVGGTENALKLLLAFVAGKWALGMLGAFAKVGGGLTSLITKIAQVALRNPWLLAFIPANNTPTTSEEMASIGGVGSNIKAEDMGKLNNGWSYSNGQWIPPKGGAGTGATLGERNNNPGNLRYAGQSGAEVGEGGFARFGSLQEGVGAIYKQLKRYAARGITTLEDMINTYAPSSENDTSAYINNLSKATGLKAGDKVDLDNPQLAVKLLKAITSQEIGAGKVSEQDIYSGYQMGAGIAANSNVNNRNSSSSSEVNIQNLNVNTQATNAEGIARDLPPQIRRNGLVAAANGGVS